jgi:predicted DNA-binding protein with PD1-like motif
LQHPSRDDPKLHLHIALSEDSMELLVELVL